MCFSANASFLSAAGLFALGLVTWRRVRRPAERPLALIPTLFGLQQLVEGGVWLTLTHDAPALNGCLTTAYSAFSQVLWPVLVPLAVLLLEATPWRRTVLAAFVAAGVATALFLGIAMLRQPVVSELQGGHIVYLFPHARVLVATTLYLLGACAAPMFSSHRSLRLFGFAAGLSVVGVYAVYSTWFISVWCFFAAALSGILLLHFPPRGTSLHFVLRPAVARDYIQQQIQNLQSHHTPTEAGVAPMGASSSVHKESP